MVQTLTEIRTEGWDTLSFTSVGYRVHRPQTLDPALLGLDFLQRYPALLDGMDYCN